MRSACSLAENTLMFLGVLFVICEYFLFRGVLKIENRQLLRYVSMMVWLARSTAIEEQHALCMFEAAR